MYNAGIRFVMIKASDTRDEADALALKFLLMDRNAAQAAGIYTGYYHYTILPNTTDEQAVIRDAQAQAQKASGDCLALVDIPIAICHMHLISRITAS
jgi:GH25 family lysozyme M1 (1,4-beta-N-acetylmuramidase)